MAHIYYQYRSAGSLDSLPNGSPVVSQPGIEPGFLRRKSGLTFVVVVLYGIGWGSGSKGFVINVSSTSSLLAEL